MVFYFTNTAKSYMFSTMKSEIENFIKFFSLGQGTQDRWSISSLDSDSQSLEEEKGWAEFSCLSNQFFSKFRQKSQCRGAPCTKGLRRNGTEVVAVWEFSIFCTFWGFSGFSNFSCTLQGQGEVGGCNSAWGGPVPNQVLPVFPCKMSEAIRP